MMTDARLQPLRERVAALEAENAELQEVIRMGRQTLAMLQERLALKDLQIQKLQSDLQQVQHDASENMMLQLLYQHYILLCVPAIQDFMLRTEQRDRSQLIHFLIHSLPEDAPKQMTDEVKKMMRLPAKTDAATIAHADQVILSAESGAQVIHQQKTDTNND